MAKRISVVISQSPSKNPVKRKLEEDILAALLFETGIDVTVVPNLYDIKPDSTSMLALQSIGGNMIVVSWLFERAAHWVLDRAGIAGHVGQVLMTSDDEDEDELEEDADDDSAEAKQVVNATRTLPNRKIYCLDFKSSTNSDEFVAEIKRIQQENSVQVVTLGDVVNGVNGVNGVSSPTALPITSGTVDAVKAAEAKVSNGEVTVPASVNRIEEKGGRRWYPVIDYNRCTNCMECIDFCLFGVYGVDRIDTILVEQPDNCRKGCPACSRVCPENAIMFPQHKTPAIAGSSDAAANLKIDLSQLFGAPATGKSAEEVAAMERDEQLLLAGRDAVGVGSPPRRTSQRDASAPRDDMDDLVDQLNDLDL